MRRCHRFALLALEDRLQRFVAFGYPPVSLLLDVVEQIVEDAALLRTEGVVEHGGKAVKLRGRAVILVAQLNELEHVLELVLDAQTVDSRLAAALGFPNAQQLERALDLLDVTCLENHEVVGRQVPDRRHRIAAGAPFKGAQLLERLGSIEIPALDCAQVLEQIETFSAAIASLEAPACPLATAVPALVRFNAHDVASPFLF